MKKALSLALALILALALAIPAFAVDAAIDENGVVSWTDGGGSTEVKYTMAGSYTVSIPDAFEISSTTTSAAKEVSVTEIMLGYNQKLVVSAYYSGALTLKNTDVEIEYSIKYATTNDLSESDAAPSDILTISPDANDGFSAFDPSAAGSKVELVATCEADAPYAGLYTDTVTFVTSVKSVS